MQWVKFCCYLKSQYESKRFYFNEVEKYWRSHTGISNAYIYVEVFLRGLHYEFQILRSLVA